MYRHSVVACIMQRTRHCLMVCYSTYSVKVIQYTELFCWSSWK